MELESKIRLSSSAEMLRQDKQSVEVKPAQVLLELQEGKKIQR